MNTCDDAFLGDIFAVNQISYTQQFHEKHGSRKLQITSLWWSFCVTRHSKEANYACWHLFGVTLKVLSLFKHEFAEERFPLELTSTRQ